MVATTVPIYDRGLKCTFAHSFECKAPDFAFKVVGIELSLREGQASKGRLDRKQTVIATLLQTGFRKQLSMPEAAYFIQTFALPCVAYGAVSNPSC